MKTTAISILVFASFVLPAPAERHAEPVEVGDFIWLGTRYKNARASMDGTGSVKITSFEPGKRPVSVSIPWDKAPFDMKGKLAAQHERALAEVRSNADPAESGLELISSTVVQVLPDGLLVWVAERKQGLLRGHPRRGELVDGDVVKVFGRAGKPFTYTNTLGAAVTVRAFDYVKEAK